MATPKFAVSWKKKAATTVKIIMDGLLNESR